MLKACRRLHDILNETLKFSMPAVRAVVYVCLAVLCFWSDLINVSHPNFFLCFVVFSLPPVYSFWVLALVSFWAELYKESWIEPSRVTLVLHGFSSSGHRTARPSQTALTCAVPAESNLSVLVARRHGEQRRLRRTCRLVSLLLDVQTHQRTRNVTAKVNFPETLLRASHGSVCPPQNIKLPPVSFPPYHQSPSPPLLPHCLFSLLSTLASRSAISNGGRAACVMLMLLLECLSVSSPGPCRYCWGC